MRRERPIEAGQNPLSRPEWEAYAISRAAGMSAIDAYADVYGQGHRGSAARLDARPEVKRRVAVLRGAISAPARVREIRDPATAAAILCKPATETAAEIAEWVGRLEIGRAHV